MQIKEEINDIAYLSAPGRESKEWRIDLLSAFYNFPSIIEKAWYQIEQRYRRSFLGPLWLVLGNLAFSVGFTLLGHNIFSINLYFYLLYIMGGVFSWGFIASCLIEATTAVSSEQNELLSRRVSITSIAVKVVARNFFVYLHGLPIAIIVMFATGRATLEALWLIPSFALIFFSLIPVIIIISVFSVRMVDVGQMVNVSLQFIVYLTPVYWVDYMIKSSGLKLLFLHYNPFYHYLNLVRSPLLGDPPPIASFIFIGIVGVVAWVVVDIIIPKERRKLVYWI